jgi:hypothetical protein
MDHPYSRATSMERPLGRIRSLTTALALLSETMGDHGIVVQELAYLIREDLDELDKIHEFFFLLHYDGPTEREGEVPVPVAVVIC